MKIKVLGVGLMYVHKIFQKQHRPYKMPAYLKPIPIVFTGFI